MFVRFEILLCFVRCLCTFLCVLVRCCAFCLCIVRMRGQSRRPGTVFFSSARWLGGRTVKKRCCCCRCRCRCPAPGACRPAPGSATHLGGEAARCEKIYWCFVHARGRCHYVNVYRTISRIRVLNFSMASSRRGACFLKLKTGARELGQCSQPLRSDSVCRTRRVL